jgi:hypothetical protein
MKAITDLHLQIWNKRNIIQLNFTIFFYTEIISETYEQYTIIGGIVTLAAIPLVPLSADVAKASSNCSLQRQAHDKTGFHTLSRDVSSQNGSCSNSLASRAGQGSGHNVFAKLDAFSDPGLNTYTCTSASTSPAGLHFQFNDDQHSGDRSCRASSQSP